ncbi:MAG: PAS domain-containing protein, partial [Methylococcales bacterium]
MKNNQPVTDIEIEVLENKILVSECDLDGNIIYANQAFCEVSGYSLEQLMGAKHNIVRHPDMPSQIYDDLWKTLKENNTWRGLLKNRTSNGDYYWVLATVKPISDDQGNIISYRSLRRKTTPEAIEQTKKLYQRLNNGEKINLNKLNPYKRHKIDKLFNSAIYN